MIELETIYYTSTVLHIIYHTKLGFVSLETVIAAHHSPNPGGRDYDDWVSHTMHVFHVRDVFPGYFECYICL